MRTTNAWQIGGLLLLLCTCGSPLIVPTGLVSLLHYIYSRIPIISKGTDSRLGVGFRFGPHADLQFLVELGPQQITQELGDPQNPPPCCEYDEPAAVQDVSNQLTGNSVVPNTRSGFGIHKSGFGDKKPGLVDPAGSRTARSGATDWLERWQAGIKRRAARSHREKNQSVGSGGSKKKASSPLLSALHRFRDLWVAGRKAATAK